MENARPRTITAILKGCQADGLKIDDKLCSEILVS